MTALRDFAAAAEWLNVSESWLRKKVAQRQVAHTRLGRNVRFTDADLAAIAAAGKVEPAKSLTARELKRRAS